MFRRFFLVACSVAGLAVLLPAAPAQALPQCQAGHYCWHYWYADPTRTDLIGLYTIDCSGAVSQWGVRQGYTAAGMGEC